MHNLFICSVCISKMVTELSLISHH